MRWAESLGTTRVSVMESLLTATSSAALAAGKDYLLAELAQVG